MWHWHTLHQSSWAHLISQILVASTFVHHFASRKNKSFLLWSLTVWCLQLPIPNFSAVCVTLFWSLAETWNPGWKGSTSAAVPCGKASTGLRATCWGSESSLSMSKWRDLGKWHDKFGMLLAGFLMDSWLQSLKTVDVQCPMMFSSNWLFAWSDWW